jgi:hypothetical protein
MLPEDKSIQDDDPCTMSEDEWAEMLYYEGLEG